MIFELKEDFKYSHWILHYNPKEIKEIFFDEQYLMDEGEDNAKQY